MTDMTETFETMSRTLMETCLKDLSVYKLAVKTVQSPAIRKLVESIIAQKTDQLADLKIIIENCEHANLDDRTAEASHTESWPDPESLLKAVTIRENDFAEATRALAAHTGLEEYRNSLCACAERSRKFASWSQDHLDLLGLF